MRTRGVVLSEDEAAAVVRADEPAAWDSLEGTRLVGVGVAELPLLLLLLEVVAAGRDVSAGASDVGSGCWELAGGADEAGGALDAGGDDEAGGADDAGVAEEAGVLLPPVPEAWRFSLWWRYSLMPSMCRLSKLKADAMAMRANSVTNSHAWRIMVDVGERGEEEEEVVVVVVVERGRGSSAGIQ